MKKMKLEDFKVKSFVTGIDSEKSGTVKGGDQTQQAISRGDCTLSQVSGTYCFPQATQGCTQTDITMIPVGEDGDGPFLMC